MPCLTTRNPKYRRHRASGQAIVTLGKVSATIMPDVPALTQLDLAWRVVPKRPAAAIGFGGVTCNSVIRVPVIPCAVAGRVIPREPRRPRDLGQEKRVTPSRDPSVAPGSLGMTRAGVRAGLLGSAYLLPSAFV